MSCFVSALLFLTIWYAASFGRVFLCTLPARKSVWCCSSICNLLSLGWSLTCVEFKQWGKEAFWNTRTTSLILLGIASDSCLHKCFFFFSFSFFYFFIFKDFIYLFLDGGEGRKKERERNIDVWVIHSSFTSRIPSTGDLACNTGMCPDWELNWWPFSSQAGA